MNSDNYEFSKSSAPQSVGDYTAYSNKQWNYGPYSHKQHQKHLISGILFISRIF